MMHDTYNPNKTIFLFNLKKNELKGLTPHQIFHHEKFEELRSNLLIM